MTNEELLQIIEQAAKDKVTQLDLSGKGLTALPAEIGQLSKLQTLDLRRNQLSSLPGEIGQLT
ncbi:MAG: leucine-rich repeat domain-containing protein, partial [Nostoc sp. DcaGUA01]|nr:leucine-rich repeat domain-containing protein [Nostoc sp. DcaGUA01]